MPTSAVPPRVPLCRLPLNSTFSKFSCSCWLMNVDLDCGMVPGTSRSYAFPNWPFAMSRQYWLTAASAPAGAGSVAVTGGGGSTAAVVTVLDVGVDDSVVVIVAVCVVVDATLE